MGCSNRALYIWVKIKIKQTNKKLLSFLFKDFLGRVSLIAQPHFFNTTNVAVYKSLNNTRRPKVTALISWTIYEFLWKAGRINLSSSFLQHNWTQGQEILNECYVPSIKTICFLTRNNRVSCLWCPNIYTAAEPLQLHWLINVWAGAWRLISWIHVPLATLKS